MRVPLFVIVVAGLCMSLGACDARTAAPSSEGSFAERAAEALEEAQVGGAGAEQIAELEVALKTETIQAEVLREASRRVVECLAAQSVEAHTTETTNAAGLVLPNYVANIGDNDSLSRDVEALVEQCDREHFYWMNQLYTFQPSAVSDGEAYFDSRVPALTACILESGGTLPDAPRRHDLVQEAERIWQDSGGAINCFREAGLDNF